MSLPRERTLILALLLILAASSWVILIWQSRAANGMGMGMGAALFLAIWVVMMIAMMFPTAAPMILVFAQVQRDRGSFERAFMPTCVFVTALIYAEKRFPLGAHIAQCASLALILYGALVIVVPAALPLGGASMLFDDG